MAVWWGVGGVQRFGVVGSGFDIRRVLSACGEMDKGLPSRSDPFLLFHPSPARSDAVAGGCPAGPGPGKFTSLSPPPLTSPPTQTHTPTHNSFPTLPSTDAAVGGCSDGHTLAPSLSTFNNK